MADNEIIKALECCSKNPPSCVDCTYKGKCNRRDCYDYLKLDALDLIKRLKGEIDRLNIELQAMRGAANSYKAEVERLKGIEKEYDRIFKENLQHKIEIESLQKLLDDTCDMCIGRERAYGIDEAIKEFAERLKGHRNGNYIFISTELLDNLVKEMVGDEE